MTHKQDKCKPLSHICTSCHYSQVWPFRWPFITYSNSPLSTMKYRLKVYGLPNQVPMCQPYKPAATVRTKYCIGCKYHKRKQYNGKCLLASLLESEGVRTEGPTSLNFRECPAVPHIEEIFFLCPIGDPLASSNWVLESANSSLLPPKRISTRSSYQNQQKSRRLQWITKTWTSIHYTNQRQYHTIPMDGNNVHSLKL